MIFQRQFSAVRIEEPPIASIGALRLPNIDASPLNGSNVAFAESD